MSNTVKSLCLLQLWHTLQIHATLGTSRLLWTLSWRPVGLERTNYSAQIERLEYGKPHLLTFWNWGSEAGKILVLRTQVSSINNGLPGTSYLTEHVYNLSYVSLRTTHVVEQEDILTPTLKMRNWEFGEVDGVVQGHTYGYWQRQCLDQSFSLESFQN